MRAQVSIQFIENLKLTTAQKAATAENPSDLVTSISFNCKLNPITSLRLQSLLKQSAALDVQFVARQASFDWQADPGMDVIRKISEAAEECSIPASTLEAPADVIYGTPLSALPDKVKEALADVEEAQLVTEIVNAGAGILETPKGRITYDNTGKEGVICANCTKKDTENCDAPVAFRDCVIHCTGLQEAPATVEDIKATMPEAVTEPGGNSNGHKESTRYIPGAGKGRRKKAVA